ncbi:MAG: ABC-type molybdate transport system, periplasmic component [Candidatus Methanohalarchaeum thermophilum]|uniref:ABC-type molybdate transport system, periplasmic component n=1 Tax=Methanohalarchaeum thermophilum TaxID=1903181 RepID=A0A1Q6DWE3_METT1|nr:MAG: ABC-type molybdate transport system, periplasmic component [Candidatus Methanohalarchaeum thermophilum]
MLFMTQRITRRSFIKTAAATGIAATIGFSGCLSGNGKSIVKISHAGSLAYPFNNIKEAYEEQNQDIEIQREAHGSVDAVRQVTELDKKIDIVGVADYTLIPNMMLNEYTDWYARFARNKYTIAYTDESSYSDEINSENWYEILGRDDVRFGFSNPNADPAGYRSQMVIQLAENYYGNNEIYENLIGQNSNFEMTEQDDEYILEMPPTSDIEVDTDKIMLRSKEVDLLSGLEGGEIDYLFIYGSVATQHEHNMIELPTEIDLSSVDYADTYGKVGVKIAGGSTVYGKPIVYGITMPNNSQNPELAADVVKFILSDKGDQIMSDAGQPPINPAVVNDMEAVPEEISDLVTEA